MVNMWKDVSGTLRYTGRLGARLRNMIRRNGLSVRMFLEEDQGYVRIRLDQTVPIKQAPRVSRLSDVKWCLRNNKPCHVTVCGPVDARPAASIALRQLKEWWGPHPIVTVLPIRKVDEWSHVASTRRGSILEPMYHRIMFLRMALGNHHTKALTISM